MAAAKQETTDPYEQIQPGDHVKHSKFGQGQVLHRTGAGEETKFVVSFAEEGEKRLLAKYAKLKKARPIESSKEPSEAEAKDADKDVADEDDATADDEDVTADDEDDATADDEDS